MAIPALKSNITIAFPVDEAFVELWPKKTAADVIAIGDVLWFDTSGVELSTASPDAVLFVGVALAASNGAVDSGFIRVAYKCVIRGLLDASGVTLPGKAVAISALSGHNWTWTAATADAYGYAKNKIIGSVFGLIIIDRDTIAVNTIRETITS